MSLRDRHEQFLTFTIESKAHHGQDVGFDLSAPDLEWWNDETGTPATSQFTLVGWANIVGENGAVPGNAADAATHRSSVTVRLSSMLSQCYGVPAAGTVVTVSTRTGDRRFVVEPGQVRVDEDLGRVQYYLTNITAV